MASNSEWKEDNLLENDLGKYVGQNFKRSEILDFVQRDFPEYTWCKILTGFLYYCSVCVKLVCFSASLAFL